MALPVVLGYLPMGFAFGVLAVKSGIPAWAAFGMALCVFAGSGQFIAASMAGMGASVLAIIAANFMVNLRHIFMAASLAHHVRPLNRLQRAFFGFEMTDEVFAVHSVAFSQGATCNPWRVFAVNITSHLGWITGCTLGALFSSFIADVKPFGLDFALTAMFLALLVPLCKDRIHLWVALAGGLLSLLFFMAGLGKSSIIAATLLAATLGLVLEYIKLREDKTLC